MSGVERDDEVERLRAENERLRAENERLRAENERSRIWVSGPMIFWGLVVWTIFMAIVGSAGHAREQRFDFVGCMRVENDLAFCEAGRDAAASSFTFVFLAVGAWIFGIVLAYLGWQDVKHGRDSRRQYP